MFVRRAAPLLLVLTILPGVACQWAAEQLDRGWVSESPALEATSGAAPVASAAAATDTNPVEPDPAGTLVPLGESMRITGTITAGLEGEQRSWHTVLSPGIGGALVNSATWSDEPDEAGFFEADLTGQQFAGGYQQPVSTLRLQFPFTPELRDAIIMVPGPGGERARAEVRLAGAGWSYQMSEGQIELQRVRVDGERASFEGQFSGRLELAEEAQGEPPWPAVVELEVGRFQILRATAKSALPGGRPPQGE